MISSSKVSLLRVLLGFLLLTQVNACDLGANCSYTDYADCSQGYQCDFDCTNGCYGLITCGSGPCNINCPAYGVCWHTTIVGGSGPVSITCPGTVSCQYLTVNVGSGPVDLSCTSGSCQDSTVVGGTGDLTVNCVSSSYSQNCQNMILTGGSGASSVTCDGSFACYLASFTFASGPTSFFCRQGSGGCDSANIYGGTGVIDLACEPGTVCALPVIHQNDAIITESAVGNGFSCQPGQWQCPTSALNTGGCFPETVGCNCDYSTHFGPNCLPCNCATGVCDAGVNGTGFCFCPYEYSGTRHSVWQISANGTYANGACTSGYSQTLPNPPRRFCKPDGTWDDHVSYSCTKNYCPADTNTATNTKWPMTGALATRIGSCIAGPTPKRLPQRVCNADGTWGPITLNKC